jgi:hypothetical protein
MEKIIRRILREITETEYLYWRLPKKLIDELGIELYDEDDVVYLNEIHFDTREILVELYTHINGELEWYDGITDVPSTFEGVYSFPLDELPKSVKKFIGRRLDPKYMKYLVTEDQDEILMNKFRRRLNYVQEYIDGLFGDTNVICNYWSEHEVNAYVNNSMWDLTLELCDQIGDYDAYDQIYEILVNNGYRDQIRDFFIDTIRNC